MQKEEQVKNTNLGRPFYDRGSTGFCPVCKGIWKKEQQIIYETRTKNRKYGTCPKCRNKIPLRKTPRTRDAWLKKFPVKRIE